MFQESALSISKPKNLRWETSTISLVLQEVETLVGAEFLVMNCIVRVFKRLTDNRLDLNHLSTIVRLALNFVSKISGLLSMTRRLVSSAKRIDKAVSYYIKNVSDQIATVMAMVTMTMTMTTSFIL
jgi:hypothetical protein